MKKQLIIKVLFFFAIHFNQNYFGFKISFLDFNKNSNKRDDEKPLTVSDYMGSGRRWKRDRLSTSEVNITGIKPEGDGKWVWTKDGVNHIRTDTNITIRLFGLNFGADKLYIGYTSTAGNQGLCDANAESPTFAINSLDTYTSYANNFFISNAGTYYLCYKYEGLNENWYYVSGADNDWMKIVATEPTIPFALQVLVIIVLLCLSGLFSGLSLGLMVLDKNELKVIRKCGTEREKEYAKTIIPVRKRGNYLLCTLLLSNVLVNSMLAIILDDLTSGVTAVVISTLAIVIFGEIIPQALCSRNGLAVGAHTVWVTYFLMIATFPLSFPISKILDKYLGEEIGNAFDRERLMEYIRVTKDRNRLEANEVNIISGALKLNNLKVIEVMTPISDVFMLSYNQILDFKTYTIITESGYSRIPIYESERNNIVGILNNKDLAFMETDQKIPIKSLIELYKNPLYFVYEDVTLDVMLNEFRKGKSHMAFVYKSVDNKVSELAGVVTLEDIIEELIGEINDETDVVSDNRRKQKRKEVLNRPNYSYFAHFEGGQESGRNSALSAQLVLAAYTFLSTVVKPFTTEYLSEKVLKHLMDKKPFYEVKVNTGVKFDSIQSVPNDYKLYDCGKAADYFILILEGRVKVIIGKENHCYEVGSFNYFGVSALTLTSSDNEMIITSNSLNRDSINDGVQQKSSETLLKISPSTTSLTAYRSSIAESSHSFIPDFSVFCIENTVYMKVDRNLYLSAIRATLMERQREPLDTEKEKVKEFGVNDNTESSKGRSNSELEANTSDNKLQSNDKQLPTDSNPTATLPPDAMSPKNEETSDSINNKNNTNINDRNSNPTDQ